MCGSQCSRMEKEHGKYIVNIEPPGKTVSEYLFPHFDNFLIRVLYSVFTKNSNYNFCNLQKRNDISSY